MGHKEDMPGAGQWRMITKQPTNTNLCWICDKQIYSLVFWNEYVGQYQAGEFSRDDRNFIAKNIERINKDKEPVQDEEDKAPYIYGQFTNWQPKRMFEIKEYCERIDTEKEDTFKRLQ